MAQEEQIFNTVAPLRNVAALTALIDRVQNRSMALPGMGVFHGPSGFGKSTAAIYATNRYHAVTVQVKSVWTKKTLCEAIMAEMSVPAAKTISAMLDQICARLAVTDQPVLIDEADFLVQRGMIEIVRDIYEGSGVPVILIGEELLPQKLQAWERVHGRILDWVAAQPGDLSDAKHLAKIYAPGITLSEDILSRLLKASHGSIRRICVNLDRVREFAKVRGLTSIGDADWAGRDFFTGEAPVGRQFAALRRARA